MPHNNLIALGLFGKAWWMRGGKRTVLSSAVKPLTSGMQLESEISFGIQPVKFVIVLLLCWLVSLDVVALFWHWQCSHLGPHNFWLSNWSESKSYSFGHVAIGSAMPLIAWPSLAWSLGSVAQL